MKNELNKNHALRTRRVGTNPEHYQVVVVNVQSGKCIKVLCDMVKTADMSQTEFEIYCEATYGYFLNPKPFDELFRKSDD